MAYTTLAAAADATKAFAQDLIAGVYFSRIKLSFGIQDNATDVSAVAPLPVYTPGGLWTFTGSFTRPADTIAYTIGDLVTAAAGGPVFADLAVRVAGEAVRIERIRLRKSSALLTNASFRVHVFRLLPTLAAGVVDNSPFNAAGVLQVTDIAGYVGSIDVTMDRAGTLGASGRGVPGIGTGMTTEPASGLGVYLLVEALAGYVGASGEVFTATLEGARS